MRRLPHDDHHLYLSSHAKARRAVDISPTSSVAPRSHRLARPQRISSGLVKPSCHLHYDSAAPKSAARATTDLETTTSSRARRGRLGQVLTRTGSCGLTYNLVSIDPSLESGSILPSTYARRSQAYARRSILADGQDRLSAHDRTRRLHHLAIRQEPGSKSAWRSAASSRSRRQPAMESVQPTWR